MQTHFISRDELAGVFLDAGAPIARDRPRPPHLRQASYDDEFDFHCLFYDAFVAPSGTTVSLVGPPLFNLAEYVKAAKFEVIDAASGQPVETRGRRVTKLNKLSRIDIELSGPVRSAVCHFDMGPLGRFDVPIGENLSSLFRGKRVAFTMFKYEPLAWLRDWAEFNVRYHGADALLICPNNCAHLTLADIAQGLSSIEGLETLVVMDWHYLYGPQADGTGMWDSNFCQLGMFEQARLRLLADAAGVLNSDIDELVVTKDHTPVFDLLLKSGHGYIQFGGAFVSDGGQEATPLDYAERRHRFYAYEGVPLKKRRVIGKKWAVVPSAFTDENQWLVHYIKGARNDDDVAAAATLCHFHNINVQWKYDMSDPLQDQKLMPGLREAYRRIGWD